ncbi:MAG: hypothetical protein U1F66_04660 [bacterium]
MNFAIRSGAPAGRDPAPLDPPLPAGPLAQRYGEAVAREWHSLLTETDPQLLAEGMLGFAQRQERAGRLDLAVEVYQSLLSFPPSPLRDRAQQGLDAILGRGAFGARAEFLLRNLAQQASEPSALLAMGAAGAVFRMTRLAALARLANSGAPGFLTQCLGAGRVASLLGFAAEAPTFSLVSRLGQEALGRPQDWGLRAVSRDLASSYLVLGGLRLAGGAAGYLAEGQATPLRGLLQQGGMFTGILLGHRLEELTGLRPRQAGATTLVDSLALLLQFNLAGRLTRAAFGPNFAAWEAGLELRSQALTQNGRPGYLPALTSNPIPWAGVATVRGVPGSRPPRWVAPQILMMMNGDGEGNGGGRSEGSEPPGSGTESRRRRDPDVTMPFSTAAQRAQAGEAAPPSGARDPFQVDSPTQLVRRILDNDLNFRETLPETDLEFHIKAQPSLEGGPISRLERYIPPLLVHLNAISIGASIPEGRRVVIVQEGEGLARRRYELIRQGPRFECHPPLPEADAAEPPTRETPPAPAPVEPKPLEALRELFPKPAEEAEPVERSPEAVPEANGAKWNLEEEEARSIPLRGQLVETLPRLLALAARQSQRRGLPGLVLLQEGELNLQTLQSLGPEAAAELTDGAVFKVFVAQSRTSFRGTVEGQALRWEPLGDESAWDVSTIFSTVTVRGVVELYQTLLAYHRSEIAPSSTELVIRFRNPAPSRDALSEFLASALDRIPPSGRDTVKVEFSGGEPELVFRRGESGRWEQN